MEAIDAVDTGMLTFFIFQPDVSFLRYGQGSFVQAKLRSTDDEDENSNGKGVIESSVVLYRVSENMPKGTGKGADKKLKYKKEPVEQRVVKFYANQALIRAQEEGSEQLLQMNASTIDDSGQFISSVLFERAGSDELEINFVTASLSVKKK
jgi:hypothetical protein